MKKEGESLADTPGERIRSARIKLGLSLAALAAKIGTTEGAIRQQEAAGPENYPKLPNALRIAAILGLDPWVLAFGQGATVERRRFAAGAQAGNELPAGQQPHLPPELEGWMERAEQLLLANRKSVERLEKKVESLENSYQQRSGGKRSHR